MRVNIQKKSGFTLIEILIVIALMGVLISGLFGGYFIVRKLMLSQNSAAIQSKRALIAIQTISEDLQNLYYETWNRDVKRQFFTAEKKIVGGQRIDSLNFPSSTLYSSTSTFQSSVKSVYYFGDIDSEGKIILYRSEDAFIDLDNTTAGIPLPLLEKVDEFKAEFSFNGQSWKDEWSYIEGKTFPKIIKITLQWTEGREVRSHEVIIRPPILWN